MKVLQQAVASYKQGMENRNFPPCFDSPEQYEAWSEHEREAPTQPIRRFVCRDCDACYQAQMTAEGRCLNTDIDVTKIVR